MFCNFLQYIHSSKDAFVTISIKKAYDNYVRDVIKEGRVTFEIKTISVKHGTLRAKVGKNRNQIT